MKTVIFDIGMVLVDYAWEAFLELFSYDDETKVALAEAIFLSDDWQFGDHGKYTPDEWVEAFVENAPGYEEEIRVVCKQIGECIHVYPYTTAWIAYYRKLGYQIFYLSNYSNGLYEKTKEKLSFLKTFDGGIFSFAEKCYKPQKEIYKRLLNRYNIEPKETIFFDDNEDNVLAARELGIEAILFDETALHAELTKIQSNN